MSNRPVYQSNGPAGASHNIPNALVSPVKTCVKSSAGADVTSFERPDKIGGKISDFVAGVSKDVPKCVGAEMLFFFTSFFSCTRIGQ